MTQWHGYFAIEDLGLSAVQRQTLRDGLIAFYQDNQEPTRQPAEILHWRLSLDGTMAIFEALFDDGKLTVATFKQFLGDTFSVDPATIDHTNSSVTLAKHNTPIIILARGGTDYLRVALFAGLSATWDKSHEAVLAYLEANRADWDGAI